MRAFLLIVSFIFLASCASNKKEIPTDSEIYDCGEGKKFIFIPSSTLSKANNDILRRDAASLEKVDLDKCLRIDI